VYLCARRCFDPYFCASPGSFDCRSVCSLKTEDVPVHQKGCVRIADSAFFFIRVNSLVFPQPADKALKRAAFRLIFNPAVLNINDISVSIEDIMGHKGN